MIYELSRKARRQIEEIIRYTDENFGEAQTKEYVEGLYYSFELLTDNPAAADRVISRIRQTIAIFETFPLMGREGRVSGTREFSIPGLPYSVGYRIASETDLDILTVFHQRRKYP